MLKCLVIFYSVSAPCTVIVSFCALRKERQVCLETNTCCYAAVSLLLRDAFGELHKSSLSSRLRQTFMWYCMIARDSGAGEVLLVSQLLTACSLVTGQRTSAEMTTANDPSHRGTTEQRWNRDLSITFSLSSFSSLSSLPYTLFRQSRPACQCGWLPPSIHPSIHPAEKYNTHCFCQSTLICLALS